MQKKGQLTIFIILGILIVLLIGSVIYITRQRITAPIEAAKPRVIKVPTEIQPLQEFVQTCLSSVAKQGLEIIGSKGGYFEVRKRYNPFEPTEGEAVQFAPDSELKIPYWWHLSSKNNCVGDCTFKTERPSLTRAQGTPSIEEQLDFYVKENLPDCLGNFEAFQAQGFVVTPQGTMKPETTIALKNIIVMLDYPLEARKGPERYELKEFVANLDLNLGEIYQLATNITNLEAEHSFLERATRSLIDVFSSTSENSLPPVTEMEFGFGTGTMWIKMDVAEKLAQVLTSYLPLLKVTYTRNYKYLTAPEGKDKKFYEILYNRDFTVPVLEPHRSLNVKFAYLPWWKPYFDLNCNGQLCQPEGISSTFGFLFGVRRYAFAYDISYPVMVEINNPDAFGGEGYSFRFMLETNLRNNEPLATLEPPLTVPETVETSSLLCDIEQRTSGNITINVKTSAGQPVDNAEIVYKCGSETCYIGRSTNGKIVDKLPRCIGGFISATHKDYAQAVQPLDIVDETAQTTTLVMGTPYLVNFDAKKWLLNKVEGAGWQLDTSAAVNQGPHENAIIMLERKGESFEEPVTVIGEVCGAPFAKARIPCGSPPTDTSKNIRIYPGRYHVTIYAFNYPAPQLRIPPDRRCYAREPWKPKKCILIPKKPIIFNSTDPLFSGHAEYDWTFTDEDLKKAKTIEFTYINYALDKVLPESRRKIEDLEIMGNLFTYSEQYKSLLKPTLK